MNQDEAQAHWMHLTRTWLEAVRPSLDAKARREADDIVLEIRIDTSEMERMLTPGSKPVVGGSEWKSIEDLFRIFQDDSTKHPGVDTLSQWAERLKQVDISRGDFAVYLHSTADSSGRWLSRLVTVIHATPPPGMLHAFPTEVSFTSGPAAEVNDGLPQDALPTFHAQAAGHFNSEANSLLSAIAPQPVVAPPSPHFTPNVPTGSHFNLDDFSRVVYSLRNSAGRVVGQAIKREEKLIGISGEPYFRFLKLTEAIQKTEGARDLLSIEFVVESLFNWLVASPASAETFTEFLVRQAGKAIKQYEIWIPIADFFPQVGLDAGIARIAIVTGELFDRTEQHVAEDSGPKHAKLIAQWLSKEKRETLGLGAVVITAVAESRRARALASERAELVTDLLRFFSPANGNPTEISLWAPLGNEPLRTSKVLMVLDGRVVSTQSEVMHGERSTVASASDVSDIRREGFDKLASVLRKDSRTDFEDLVVKTIALYSRGALTTNPAQRLVYQFAALEGLLLKNTSEPIQQNIAERMAFFAATDPNDRELIISSVRGAYDLRSKFLHHAKAATDTRALARFSRNSWRFLTIVIQRMSDYSHSSDFFRYIDDIKFGRTPSQGKDDDGAV